MRYNLRITHLLILFYLLGSFASATHIHKDATVHTDCKICLLSDSMHGGDVVVQPMDTLVLPNYILTLYFLHLTHINPILKGFYAQAPPLFS